MKLQNNQSLSDPFTDLLFNVLLGFVFLFFITILFINPITKLGNVNLKAEFIITLDWKDSLPDDIDLWVQDPNGEIVSYLKKDAGWLHLDRDDQGEINDTLPWTNESSGAQTYSSRWLAMTTPHKNTGWGSMLIGR